MNPKITNIGKISGNFRIDPDTMEEEEADTPDQLHLWLEEVVEDEDFYEDIVDMVQDWEEQIKGEKIDPATINVHMTGESHLDMAFRWRYEQTIKKANRTLTKAVLHSGMFPEFRYISSNAQVMAWTKEFYPELYEKVKECVKRGQIIPIGGSWVEADCMMPSGEAFVRQRLHGMKLYKDEFGPEFMPKLEWYPDTFGYSVGLPQILKKSGAEYFLTSKLDWNARGSGNDIPFVHFWWKSPDGTSILSCNSRTNMKLFGTIKRYWKYRHLLKEGAKKNYDYTDGFEKVAEALDPSAWATPASLFMGKGDGGHGPQHREVAEMLAYAKTNDRTKMNFFWSTPNDYFKEVSKFSDRLPTWEDELYLEFHRGTFSVHPEIKRYNRKHECLLQAAETLVTFVSLFDTDFVYPYEALEAAWRLVLLNQFHDVLPGSCIVEVMDDLVEAWPGIEFIADEILEKAFSKIKHKTGSSIFIYNPLPWARKDRLFIPVIAMHKDVVLDKSGKPPSAKLIVDTDEFTCQPVAAEPEDLLDNRPAGWWTIIELPAYGILDARIKIVDFEDLGIAVQAGQSPMISNGICTVKLDSVTGGISALKVNDINGGNNLLKGVENNLVVGFEEDELDQYQAWDLKKEYWNFPLNYPNDKDVKIEVFDQGSIFASLIVKRTVGDSPTMQIIRLFKDDPRVHCYWYSDWQEKSITLKLGVSTTTGAEVSTSDQMYCAIERKTNPETKADKARYEKTMQKYVDLSTPDNTWGIALLNEGKYAYDTEGDQLRFTIHRSPLYPPPNPIAWVVQEREERKQRDGTEPPRYAGLGPSSCRYAFLPHEGGTLVTRGGKPSSFVKKSAEEYNYPFIVKSVSKGYKAFDYPSMIFETPENVLITALKMKEWERDYSIILRISEICGQDIPEARIVLPEVLLDRVASIRAVDLLERASTKEFSWNSKKNLVSLHLGKFEICTFELELKKT
ncbi:MAG: alpha-mannosidase [Candidatus Hodarchaeota archaeon]